MGCQGAGLSAHREGVGYAQPRTAGLLVGVAGAFFPFAFDGFGEGDIDFGVVGFLAEDFVCLLLELAGG